MVNFSIKLSRKLGYYDCAIAYSHDNWFENGNYFGGCNEIVRTKVRSEKKISWLHGEPMTTGLTAERLYRTYEGFNEIVTVSNACKQQFEVLSGGKIKCKCIKNLYNIDEIAKKTRDITYHENSDRVLRIVTVGRLSKVAKRIDKINEIARLLKKNDYPFDWTVVGDGSEYERCINICKEYGMMECVHYIGNQSNPYPYMKRSDILVLVSDSEASPMVLNEALIVGTPVLSTDFQAAYESVEDGKNGLICGKDVQSIYEKIVYCIEHPDLLNGFRKYIAEHPVNNDKSIQDLKELIG